jgi:hypothetical protein
MTEAWGKRDLATTSPWREENSNNNNNNKEKKEVRVWLQSVPHTGVAVAVREYGISLHVFVFGYSARAFFVCNAIYYLRFTCKWSRSSASPNPDERTAMLAARLATMAGRVAK